MLLVIAQSTVIEMLLMSLGNHRNLEIEFELIFDNNLSFHIVSLGGSTS